MTSKVLDSGFHTAGGRSAILPTSLTMPLAYTNTSQIGKYLKRRSVSLSSESSSFSLPFKKRRFVLIAADEDEDHDDDEHARNTPNGAAASTPSFGLSPIHADSSGETKVLQQQQQQRDTMVATPTQSIDGKGSSTTTAPPLIACITPVPGTPKFGKRQELVVNVYSKEMGLSSASTPPALLVCKPAEDETETETVRIDNKSPTTTTSLSFHASPLPMQTRSRRNSHGSASSASSSVSHSGGSSTNNSNHKRLSQPKLNAPLPNGCHGQTSRTQSFCRRGPNYNGSNYCKLHYFDPRYQSLIQEQERTKDNNATTKMEPETSTVRRTQEPTESIDTSKNPPPGTKPLDMKKEETKEPTESISNGSSSSTSTTKPNKKRAPRDKLYRGLSNHHDDGGTSVEVRCLAISTRGKRCCYAAVACHGNQYCHRHSSFFVKSSGTDDDTTASTTRSHGDKDTQQTKKTKKTVAEPTPSAKHSKVEAVSKTTPTPSSSVRRRSGATFRREASEPAAVTGTEPRPPTALSDLSTDLWQNRKVLVSKGPHKSKVGTVQRWRNGWVTVELEEREQTVCHNRRSYELFLV